MKKALLLILCLFIFPVLSIRADTRFEEEGFVGYSGILAPTQEEYLKIEQAKMIRTYAKPDQAAYSGLPARVDLSQALPEVPNQGVQNSCVGWVLSFAMKSFQENRELGWGYSNRHLFSPSFVYNQVNDGVDQGADILKALEFMRQHGTVPMTMMPYNEKDYKSGPSAMARQVAKGFRILGYRRVNEKDVNQVKSYLASGEPVALIMQVHSNFLKKGMSKAGGLYKAAAGNFVGYHAVTAVGYDDEKRAIKIMNSWGKQWGENGYGWISYDVFPETMKQAYVMYDRPTDLATVAAVEGKTLQQLADKMLPPPADTNSTTTSTTTATNTTVPTTTTSVIKPGGTIPSLDKAQNLTKVLIVPDEAGIITDDKWLRLSSPTDDAVAYLKNINVHKNEIQTMNDVLGTKTITKLTFNPSSGHDIMTNQGISFGMTKEDVERIYRKADYVDPSTGEETYFYQSATDDWGGLPVTRVMSLSFHYDESEKISQMTLEKVFKNIKTNQGFVSLQQGSEIVQNALGQEIVALSGDLHFLIPAQFNDIKKADWGGGSAGYFAKNTKDPFEYIVVKIFEMGQEVTEEMIQKRIDADITMLGSQPQIQDQTLAKIDWKEVIISDSKIHYYSKNGTQIYQVQMATSGKLIDQDWFPIFWKGFLLQ